MTVVAEPEYYSSLRNDELVVETLRQVAEERPEYVYDRRDEGCVYVDYETHQPSCLVGHVLVRLGVPAELFLRDPVRNVTGIDVLVAHEALPLSRSAIRLLCRAQMAQDEGETWGASLAEALAAEKKGRP